MASETPGLIECTLEEPWDGTEEHPDDLVLHYHHVYLGLQPDFVSGEPREHYRCSACGCEWTEKPTPDASPELLDGLRGN